MQMIAQHEPFPLAVLSLDGMILRHNRGAERIFQVRSIASTETRADAEASQEPRAPSQQASRAKRRHVDASGGVSGRMTARLVQLLRLRGHDPAEVVHRGRRSSTTCAARELTSSRSRV